MLISPSILSVQSIDRDQLNGMLLAWGHRMGVYSRPRFTFEAHHALFHHDVPVAVTAAGETVRDQIGRTPVRRQDAVELVRLCAARADLCRPMLRLWREFIFPDIARAHHRWIAVSYQDEALHSGNLYRFDGWTELGAAGGGGTDSRTGRKGRSMRLWGWPLPGANVAAERYVA